MYDVNAHLHTPYSFSAFSSIDEALDRALKEGVKVVGINDFYSMEGYGAWNAGCMLRGLFPLFGIEFISLNEEDQAAGLRVNDPNNPEPITIEAVFKLVGDAAKKGEIDLLVVDYIGIMGTKREFREERLKIAYISRELKRLAMVANIPVIALCQVNRMAQGRMPTMAELRDSGAVEQDADGIIFLHRPESHEDKSIHPKDIAGFYSMQEGGSAYIAISVAKQRNGQTGVTQVMFDPGVMRYNEIMRETT